MQAPGVNRGRGGHFNQGNRQQAAGRAGAGEVPMNISSNTANCGLCKQEVGDDAIGCDACSDWFHPMPQCTGLTQTIINAIQEDGGNALTFKCSLCRCSPLSQSRGTHLKLTRTSTKCLKLLKPSQ